VGTNPWGILIRPTQHITRLAILFRQFLSARYGPFGPYRCVRITRYLHSSPSYRHVHGALRAPTNINNCMARSRQLHRPALLDGDYALSAEDQLMTRKFYEQFIGVTSEAPGGGIAVYGRPRYTSPYLPAPQPSLCS